MTAPTAKSLYPPALLAHAKDARHEGPLADATHSARCSNPLCGDRVHLHLRLVDGRIDALRFEAKGCAIAKASAALLAEWAPGHSPDEALKQGERLQRALAGQLAEFGGFEVLAGVRDFPTRVGCATLAWQTLKACLEAGPT